MTDMASTAGSASRGGPGAWLRRALLPALVAALALGAREATAQALVPGGDFDICDNLGTLRGNTAFLQGRAGFGTNIGEIVFVNAATSDQDCDHDGFTPGIDFVKIDLSRPVSDFVKIDDPGRTIRGSQLVLRDVPRPLRNGNQNTVGFLINIPAGTQAGRYRGSVSFIDSLLPVGTGPNGEALRTDRFFVEIEVLPTSDIGLVQGDKDSVATQLTLRGRAGQTVSAPIRIANTGNVDLANVRIEATELTATSGTGLRIRRDRISFSPTLVNQLAFQDTARIIVTVRIPTGLLAGTYTGELIVQGEGIGARRIPLNVIVSTAGDIVFETNPVVSRQGDQAVVIFNGDPGTRYRLRIFDMMGLTVFGAEGVVFAGVPPGGQPGAGTTFPPDQAVRFNWNLTNGRGEQVAGGMYVVVVDVQQDGARRQLRDKLMVIR